MRSLISVLLILLAVSVQAAEVSVDSLAINQDDIIVNYWRSQYNGSTDHYGSYGAEDTAWLGVATPGIYPYTMYRLMIFPRYLSDSASGTIDGGGIRLHVEVATDSAETWIDVYTLDTTKGVADGGTGSQFDCGTNWVRYIEGHGGDPTCADTSWSTGGGDYYATVRDSFYLPTDTGFTTYTFGDSMVAWLQRLMDGDWTAESGTGFSERYYGGLFFRARTEAASGTRRIRITTEESSDDDIRPIMWLTGDLTDLNAPDDCIEAMTKIGWSKYQTQTGGSCPMTQQGMTE